MAWFVMLLYLFDDETVIAFCGFWDDNDGEDVMFCNARYALVR